MWREIERGKSRKVIEPAHRLALAALVAERINSVVVSLVTMQSRAREALLRCF